MKTKMKTKSVLPYFGSDSEVAPQIAKLLDHCRHVTIPFVGGAGIIQHLKVRAIVANDLHDLALTFYRTISGVNGKDAQNDLMIRCGHTLSHPGELTRAVHLRESGNDSLRAWAFWAVCWIGRKGQGGTRHQGGMPSVRRTASGRTNASRIKAAASDLPAWAEHFRRCEWECVCFRELLPKVEDREDCGIYCDPPWVGAGRDYVHTFTERDHQDLREHLGRFRKTKIVVRYGDSPLIRDLYEGWEIIEATSRDQHNTIKGEIWITN